MNELRIFELVLPVLAPVLVGWCAVRVKVLKAGDAKALTSAYLYIFLPALIVQQLSRQKLAELFDGRFIVATLGLMLGIYVAVLVLQRVVLRRSLAASVLAAFAAAKFNAVVVGLPLLLIAIGKQAIVAVIVNMVVGYLTILPLTLFLLGFAKAKEVGHELSVAAVAKSALGHTFLDPLILATLTGLAIAAVQMALPVWLDHTLLELGKAAVPVPLVAVGMTIDAAGFRERIGEAIWISAARVIASPVLAILAARWLALSPAHSIALVVSFGLPTAKMAFALAESQGEYERPMAAIVTITTLSMAVLYPVLIWICDQLWPGVVQGVV